MTNWYEITNGDSEHIRKRAVGILRERGAAYELPTHHITDLQIAFKDGAYPFAISEVTPDATGWDGHFILWEIVGTE